MTNEEILDDDPVQVAKKLQKLKGLEDRDENKEEEAVGRRKTAYNLAMNSGKAEEGINDLDLAFRRRYAMFQRNGKNYNIFVLFNVFKYLICF